MSRRCVEYHLVGSLNIPLEKKFKMNLPMPDRRRGPGFDFPSGETAPRLEVPLLFPFPICRPWLGV